MPRSTRPRRPTEAELIAALHRLELHLPVTMADVRTAHRRLARQHHPDRFPERSQRLRASETMKAINLARALLIEYLDEFLGDRPTVWTRRHCVQCCAAYEHLWPLDPRD